MRIEIAYKPSISDGRGEKYLELANSIKSIKCHEVRIVDVYLINQLDELTAETAKSLLWDPVSQLCTIDDAVSPYLKWKDEGQRQMVEVSYKAGVTNPIAITLREALERELGFLLPKEALIQTARQYIFNLEQQSSEAMESLSRRLYNPLIEREEIRSENDLTNNPFPSVYPSVHEGDVQEVETFNIASWDDDDLLGFSKERLLALSLEEMKAIQAYYAQKTVIEGRKARGISPDPTDVELEMLAQSWSEHCKHKIFAAHIDYSDPEKGEKKDIDGLFKSFIKATTDELTKKRPDLRSVFHDNSGVVDFDEDTLICFKAETHNSPSALDPYGGAITGIVGVNRDILGTGKGAWPLFNTNVLCFGEPNTDPKEVPEGLLHPKRVMDGVYEGIIDGGNQSGIPTVGGAFLFDQSYLGKPLVFCGTGGIMPRKVQGEDAWIKHIDAGDYAVMVGGRVGKDGIHGATFSSLVLDEESPSSAVQIGDPITQRKVIDFLLEARDLGLYSGITDNGAGGLSSSLGEMAEYSGGLEVHLELCPLKYEGLSPWEIWVSESQERMSLSVKPEYWDAFQALAKRRSVEATHLGSFTDSGFIDLRYKGDLVCSLDLNFIHDGLPQMQLKARWIPSEQRRPYQYVKKVFESKGKEWSSGSFLRELALEILAEPNVRSKEALVRQYDHEVQGYSVIKPFMGIKRDGPTDGAVLRPKLDSKQGITVTHGINPRISVEDTRIMAQTVVDEAYRSHIALGGDPNRASGLDNFCWPDPVESEQTPDGQYKLAQLVRANEGLKEACLAYNIPLISGKDSMKNDASVGGIKVSVKPTLLFSLMGIASDYTKAPGSAFRQEGDLIYFLGSIQKDLGGSIVEKILVERGIEHLGRAPEVNLEANMNRYQILSEAIQEGLLESIHDVSEGGVITALFESSIGNRNGADIDLSGAFFNWDMQGTNGPISDFELLFNESPGCFIISVKPENQKTFQGLFNEKDLCFLGKVGSYNGKIDIYSGTERKLLLTMDEVVSAWKSDWE